MGLKWLNILLVCIWSGLLSIEGSVNFNLTSIWYKIVDPISQTPDIEVSFDNRSAQKLILYHYNAIPNSRTIDPSKLCNYIGYIEGHEETRVAISGCLSEVGDNDKAFITLLSKNSLYQKSFTLDRYGHFKEVKPNTNDYEINNEFDDVSDDELSVEDRDVHFDDWHTWGNQKRWDKKEHRDESITEEQRKTVPYSLNLNFRFGYDKGTKEWMAENDENIDNWLSEVMTHLQIHFTHSTLEHYIFLNNTYETFYISEELQCPNGRKAAIRTIKRLHETDVAYYAIIINRGCNGVSGGVGTACDNKNWEKVSLARGPTRGVIETAETLAHELGHVLGMYHDFEDDETRTFRPYRGLCRRQSDGAKLRCSRCSNYQYSQNHGRPLSAGTGQKMDCCNGFMGYYDHPHIWSKCSVRFFRDAYIINKWEKCLYYEPLHLLESSDSEDGIVTEMSTTLTNVTDAPLTLPKVIHCEWDDWVIGECSRSCGTGTRTNNRTKLVEEANGGTCSGQPSEIVECNTQPCPVHCEWDEWNVGECSKSCGGGIRTNYREPSIDAKHGGEDCSGSSIVEESCNVQECPVDCEWEEWNIGYCSKSCGGGTRINYREKIKDEEFGGICEGETDMEEVCNTEQCPVDCEWSQWMSGDCSKSCGGGNQTRFRSKIVEEKFGGSCSGESMLTTSCNTEQCQELKVGNCSCSSYISESGAGLCRTSYIQGPICYVNEPSTCEDLHVSSIENGKRYSWEACKNDPSLTYHGFDLWERLKAFNDSFTIWHLESVSLLSAMIKSIESNGKEIFSVKQDEAAKENQINAIDETVEITNPFQEPLTSNIVASDKDSLQSNILPSSSEISTRSAPSTLATTNRPFHVDSHVSNDDAIKSEIKSGTQEIYGSELRMGWSHWSSWTTCSTTCGEGEMLRSRTCIGACLANEHGAHEAKACNLASCEAPMKISVKIWKRKYLTLVVDDDQTIEDIKKKIEDKESIETKHQSLFFNGKPLENDRTLFDYMIRKDSTLYLYLRENELNPNGCPLGYVKSVENVPDVKSSLGIHIASRDECADLCFRSDECVSFEHSKNERKCILNPRGQLHQPYEGYLFCYNIASVNCGNRTARTCNLCPETEAYDREETWCNGDCEWNQQLYSCIEKTI